MCNLIFVRFMGSCCQRRNSGGTKQCTADDRMVSVHFKWYEVTKEVSSIMMGSSPEFELALYTLCFIGGTEQNHVHFGGWDVRVRCALLEHSLACFLQKDAVSDHNRSPGGNTCLLLAAPITSVHAMVTTSDHASPRSWRTPGPTRGPPLGRRRRPHTSSIKPLLAHSRRRRGSNSRRSSRHQRGSHSLSSKGQGTSPLLAAVVVASSVLW